MRHRRRELEAQRLQLQNQNQLEEEKDLHAICGIDKLLGRSDQNKRFIGIFKLRKESLRRPEHGIFGIHPIKDAIMEHYPKWRVNWNDLSWIERICQLPIPFQMGFNAPQEVNLVDKHIWKMNLTDWYETSTPLPSGS